MTIRSLLAKAESTEFPEEAAAFTAKATELMARYAIDESLVWAGSDRDRDEPIEVLLLLERPYLAQKAVLVHQVAQAMDCRAVRFVGVPGGGLEHVAVVGFPADVAVVETLVTSLLVQLTVAARAGQPGGLTSAQAASWRRSFISGFTDSVAERLRSARRREASAAPPVVVDGRSRSVELVLADRAGKVAADLRRRYPRLQTSRASVGSSAHGHAGGRAAGRRADLGGTRIGRRGALPS